MDSQLMTRRTANSKMGLTSKNESQQYLRLKKQLRPNGGLAITAASQQLTYNHLKNRGSQSHLFRIPGSVTEMDPYSMKKDGPITLQEWSLHAAANGT